MKRLLLLACGFVATSMAIAGCTELTGPKSPETPTNVVATLQEGNKVQVSWTPSPQSDGVVSYNVLRNGSKVGEAMTNSFIDSGLAEKQTYKYTVSANCTSGVLSDPSPESAAATVVTFDLTPPRIIAIQPPLGSVNVSTFATSTVTFSEAMDPTTINTTTYSLKVTATGANIPGTVTYNPTTLVAEFKPTSQLPSSTNITATVTAGMKDVSGNPLLITTGSPGIWSFTTADQTPPTVTAVSPANGATQVNPNSVVNITFSEAMDASTINGTNITLRLSSSGASATGTVTYNATSHVATFTPASALGSPANYTVTVSTGAKDVAGNAMAAAFQSTFTTADFTAPTVVSTVPANLATSVPVTTVVTATFSKAMDPATINTTTFTLKVTATSTPVTGTVTYNAATNTATFTPSASLASATTYTATITTGARDTFGNALVSNFNWTFITADIVPPFVNSITPTPGQTNVAITTAVNIQFSETMDASTINSTNITVKNTATSALVAGTVTYSAANSIGTFTPTAPLSNGTQYTVTVTTGVKDLAGNSMVSQFTSTFTTAAAPDTTPPTVTSTSPADGATNVAVPTNVTATFSEAMDASTINGTTFTLKITSGGAAVAGTVTYNAGTKTATFTPTSALSNSTGYTATITTGAKDVAGNALAVNKIFAFTTVADTTPPTVLSTSPTDGATGVAITATVKVTFSEAMDATTINGTTFSLKITSSSAAVAGTVTYDATTHVATFTPTASLLPSTGYTATVTTGAKDAAGNALSPGTVTFAFTTAP